MAQQAGEGALCYCGDVRRVKEIKNTEADAGRKVDLPMINA